jgi:hypothetical protein
MTAQPPAAKASGVSSPLAFLSPLPLAVSPLDPLPPSQDFSEVISDALTAKEPQAEAVSKAASSDKQAKPQELTADASSLLLALLTRSLSVSQLPPEPQSPVVPKDAANADGKVSAKISPEAVVKTPGWTPGLTNLADGTTDRKSLPGPATPAPKLIQNSSDLSAMEKKPEPLSSAGAALPAESAAPADGAKATAKANNHDWLTGLTETTTAMTERKSLPGLATPAPKLTQHSADLSATERKPEPLSTASAAPPTETAVTADDAKATASAVKAAGNAGAAAIGTAVADTSQRMNLSAERNDFAGRTEQKVPPGAVTAAAVAGVDAASASRDRKAKPKLQFDWHDTPAQVLTIMDPSGKAVQNAREIEGSGSHPAANGQLSRLEMFVTREAVNIRQKGAESLSVSLKVDAGTELFLQLTNKDGQLQASLRCERGDFSALESQWTQLQQSLARQNVQLMPLGSGQSSNSQQPSEHQQRQLAQSEEGLASRPVVETKQTRGPKPQARSRHGWESWA